MKYPTNTNISDSDNLIEYLIASTPLDIYE